MRSKSLCIAALLCLVLGSANTALAHDTLDPGDFDTAVTPCSDFFDYVNGRWLARTEIPPNRSRVGSFDELRVRNLALLTKALQELRAHPDMQTSHGIALATSAFAAGMNLPAIEAAGVKPIQPLLDRIDDLKKREDLGALLATLQRSGIAGPLSASVSADSHNTRRHVLSLQAAGLGLPDRKDYLDDDPAALRLRAAYRVYVTRLFVAAHLDANDAGLNAELALETQLAEAMATRADLRDPNAVYNPTSPTELARSAPGLAWANYLGTLTEREVDGHAQQGVDRLLLNQPDYVHRLAELAATVPLPVWRDYLRLRLLDTLAPHLPSAFAEASFAFRDTAVRGQTEAPPRNEMVITALGGSTGHAPLGMALGEVFVEHAFSPAAQERAQALVKDIKAALRARIEKLDWMSEPTKLKALDKLDAMVAKVGAPAHFPRYKGLSLSADDYAGNELRIAAWHSARAMASLDRPVDRSKWSMAPYVVNAEAGGLNEITIPAGILQAPFFDPKADDAVNYGGIGAVIGHEITHHFDDRGRNFDASGALKDWWTEADAQAYKARAASVVALYSSFEPLPGQHINGRLTLGENISDMSGVELAHDALQAALKRSGKSGPIDDLTPEQRFFLSYAEVWRSQVREQALANQLRTDPHSPGRYRVQAPLANLPAFARAFSCKAGDPMVAAEPSRVW